MATPPPEDRPRSADTRRPSTAQLRAASAQQFAEIERHLDSELKGRLPCISCGYDLQGLTVRGVCPECGLAVQATILFKVDPHAEAFTPLRHRRFVAWSTVVWLAAPLAAALLAWSPRIDDLLQRLFQTNHLLPRFGALPAALVALSGAAATALVYPTAETPRANRVAAAIACVAYAPLTILLWWLYTRVDPGRPAPYFTHEPQADRLMLRLAIGALTVVILMGLRPNARRLAARSVILRTGRVDRQTIAATVAAIAVAAVGDLVRLSSLALPSSQGQWVSGAGTLIVLVGSLLFTLALFGALVDAWRIRRAILTPTPSLRQITTPPSQQPS